MAGTGLGGFAAAPTTTYLLETYSLRGTFLILGGFQLHIAIAAILFRPLSFYHQRLEKTTSDSSLNNNDSSEKTTSIATKALSLLIEIWGIFKTPGYACLCVCKFFVLLAYFTMSSILLPSWALEIGLDSTQTFIIVSVFAACDAVGRIIFGVINDLNLMPSRRLTIIDIGLVTLVSALLPTEGTTFNALCALCVGYGLLMGGFMPLQNVILYQIVDRSQAEVALGMLAVFAFPQIFLQQTAGM